MLTAVQPSSPLLSRPQSSHSTRQQFAAASSPKPSPTKRAHSSPSPTLTSQEFDHSPRVSRTKLSDPRDHPRPRPTSPVVIALSEGKLEGALEHARSAPEPLVGLGVAVGHEEPPAHEPAEDEEPPQPLVSALEQSRKLATMPRELSFALSRLSSQHHHSEYNVLKRVIAASLANPLPNPSPRLPNLPQSTPLSQRSQSNPPSSQQPAPGRATTPVRALSGNVAPLWSSLVNFRQPESNERDSPVAREGSRSVPALSRAATPPPRAAAASTLPDVIQTTLTPNLVNFAFSSPAPRSPAGLSSAEPIPSADVAAALSDALKSTLDRTRSAVNGTPLSSLPTPCTTPPVPFLPGMQIINGFAVKTSASHPMNISPILPTDFIALLASSLFGPSSSKSRAPLMPSAALSTNPPTPTPTRPFLLEIPSSCDLWALTAAPPSPSTVAPFPAAAAPHPASRTFGNFLLSSCPGKKVRLGAQPVRGGRQGICRDLKMDLQRAKDEGVKLIICCLDDQELGYLGAPWDEYSRAAHALSLSVIRVPMMEGFAPQSPAALDAHLSHIIRTHTLRGESVLAHCRGGIGRAGLVACCWMVKCGLVGLDLEAGLGESEGEGERGREAMRVVEKVIDVVRKRRSVKAIETPQQVHFLLDYVSFLQAQATLLRTADA